MDSIDSSDRAGWKEVFENGNKKVPLQSFPFLFQMLEASQEDLEAMKTSADYYTKEILQIIESSLKTQTRLLVDADTWQVGILKDLRCPCIYTSSSIIHILFQE